jgi:nucleotide-binding universal stress UspA family protein
MGNQQQLVMDRAAEKRDKSNEPASAIGTILLHIHDDEFHDGRIETALSLARACSAHVSCLHVTPIEGYVAFDSFGGVYIMDEIIRTLDQRDAELRKRVEARFNNEDVAWDYEQVSGNVSAAIASRAALADIVVVSRQGAAADVNPASLGMLGSLLHHSRVPLLVPSADAQFDPAGPALIAWNGSFEAANAVRSSLGLLRQASAVRIVEVEDTKPERNTFPGTRLLQYLSRHGIHAELAIERPPGGEFGNDAVKAKILASASSLGAAYVVMGAYSHSRAGEYLFGGITRALLEASPVALLMAH